MSSLGFTSKEQRNLGLLVHLMTSNPKILYSPVGTQADRVISKVGRVQELAASAFGVLLSSCVQGSLLPSPQMQHTHTHTSASPLLCIDLWRGSRLCPAAKKKWHKQNRS